MTTITTEGLFAPFPKPNATVSDKWTESGTTGAWARFEVITPEVAAKYLERNVHNRTLSETTSNIYGRDMSMENWTLTSNGIGFDTNGVLCDGQHRLEAIIRSGEPQEFLVVYNLPVEARDVTDIHRIRTVGDQLKMNGFTNAPQTASTARLLMEYEGDVVGLNRRANLTKPEIFAYAKEHSEELHYAINRSFPVHKAIGVSKTAVSASYVLFSRINDEQAKDYYQKLATGLNLEGPVLTVRERLLKESKQVKTRVKAGHVMYILIRGWNGIRQGETQLNHIKVPDVVTGKSMLKAI